MRPPLDVYTTDNWVLSKAARMLAINSENVAEIGRTLPLVELPFSNTVARNIMISLTFLISWCGLRVGRSEKVE